MRFQVRRLVGVGIYIINRTKYKSNPMLVLFHISFQDTCFACICTSSLFSELHCFLNTDRQLLPVCFLPLLLGPVSVPPVSSVSNLQFDNVTHPRPSLPVEIVPTRYLCLSLGSALSTALFYLRFRQVFTSIWDPLSPSHPNCL